MRTTSLRASLTYSNASISIMKPSCTRLELAPHSDIAWVKDYNFYVGDRNASVVNENEICCSEVQGFQCDAALVERMKSTIFGSPRFSDAQAVRPLERIAAGSFGPKSERRAVIQPPCE